MSVARSGARSFGVRVRLNSKPSMRCPRERVIALLEVSESRREAQPDNQQDETDPDGEDDEEDHGRGSGRIGGKPTTGC
jgi:hypothetical protein